MRLLLFLVYLTGLAVLKYLGLQIGFELYCVRSLLAIIIAIDLLAVLWLTMNTNIETVGDVMGCLPGSHEWHQLVCSSLFDYFGTKTSIYFPGTSGVKVRNNSVQTPMIGSRGYTTRKRGVHSSSARRFSNTTGIITKTSFLSPVTSRALQLGGLRPIGSVTDSKLGRLNH